MSEGGGIMDPTDQVPDLPRPLQRGDQLSLYASTVSGEAEGVAATLKVTGRGACSRPVQQLSAIPVWKGGQERSTRAGPPNAHRRTSRARLLEAPLSVPSATLHRSSAKLRIRWEGSLGFIEQ